MPEDAESEEQLNCFIIGKPAESITLGQIKQDFPLPGNYHFRFLYTYQSNSCKVWLDLPSNDSIVPLFDGEIRVKATRNDWLPASEESKQQIATKDVKQMDRLIQMCDA